MDAPAPIHVDINWAENMNTGWAGEDVDSLANRDEVQSMYNFLVNGHEVRIIPPSVLPYNDVQMLPYYLYEVPSTTDLEHFIGSVLSSQVGLAWNICSSTSFSVILQERLLILKRIYHAIVTKYHDRDKAKPSAADTTGDSLAVQRETLLGSQALLEVGVQTGLSLLFALLRHNWYTSSVLGITSMCNSVFETAAAMIQNLPPLSLANDMQLTPLGVAGVQKVFNFLKEEVLGTISEDPKAQLLASELLLGLALQRGSLRYVHFVHQYNFEICS